MERISRIEGDMALLAAIYGIPLRTWRRWVRLLKRAARETTDHGR